MADTREVYNFSFSDPEIEKLFLRYVGYERTSTEAVINTAILLYLSHQVGLNKAERQLIRNKAYEMQKRWVTQY